MKFASGLLFQYKERTLNPSTWHQLWRWILRKQCKLCCIYILYRYTYTTVSLHFALFATLSAGQTSSMV